VTGGAVRLGRAFALHLARRGHPIALHWNTSRAPAEETAEEIRRLGVPCRLFQADLTAAARLDPLIAEVVAAFPDLEVLVNSASTYHAGTITATTLDAFEANFAVNFRAPFFLSRAFAARREKGLIVNILDNKIHFHQHEYSSYLLAKKALAAFTPMAAREWAPGIRVCGLAPGVVLPASSRGEAYMAWRISGIPLARQGEVGHLLSALDYLLDNEFVTGQILTVDGGESLAGVGRNFEAWEAERARRKGEAGPKNG